MQKEFLNLEKSILDGYSIQAKFVKFRVPYIGNNELKHLVTLCDEYNFVSSIKRSGSGVTVICEL